MSRIVRASLLSLVLAAATMACAGDANVAPATPGDANPVATATPLPTAAPLLPSAMTLVIAASFKDSTNSFGRVDGRLLDGTVTSNAPAFNAFVTITEPSGRALSYDEINVDRTANFQFQVLYPVKGTYVIEVKTAALVPLGQPDGFHHWVGEFGERLDGNPLAYHDPEHPGLLALRNTLTVTN